MYLLRILYAVITIILLYVTISNKRYYILNIITLYIIFNFVKYYINV